MDKKDVLNFVKENPYCAVATIDGNQPRVRMFASLFFDDDKIYFTTGATKNVFNQLSGNPKVELCYMASDLRTMLRISGKIEVVEDLEKKRYLIETRDYLKGFRADDPAFKLLRVAEGKARFWTLDKNLKEDELEIIEI